MCSMDIQDMVIIFSPHSTTHLPKITLYSLGLPLSETTLPDHLKLLGYKNHIVGKWHLGHYKSVYTPLHRGFDSHYGYWTGHQDYYDHTAVEWVRVASESLVCMCVIVVIVKCCSFSNTIERLGLRYEAK